MLHSICGWHSQDRWGPCDFLVYLGNRNRLSEGRRFISGWPKEKWTVFPNFMYMGNAKPSPMVGGNACLRISPASCLFFLLASLILSKMRKPEILEFHLGSSEVKCEWRFLALDTASVSEERGTWRHVFTDSSLKGCCYLLLWPTNKPELANVSLTSAWQVSTRWSINWVPILNVE